MRRARTVGAVGRALCACVVLAAAAGANGKAAPQPQRFEIVTSDDSAVTQRIAGDLRERLPKTLAGLPSGAGARTHGAKTIYIAVGPLALRTLASRPVDGVVISAYTSSQVWHAVMAGVAPARAAAFTAIYAEPAPVDQLRLVALVYKRPVRIAAILGDDTTFLQPILTAAAAEASAQVKVEAFHAGDNINRPLTRLAQTAVLLAMPDSSVYNGENIRNILLSSYRHNQGVIGFSADMVQAGALATTYSDIADIDTQIGEIAAEYAGSGALPAPQFPRYFDTVVNEGVARSLGVVIDPAVRGFARHPRAGP